MLSLPAFIPDGLQLASIHNEINAVQLTAAFSDVQLLVGKGAGGGPTASAVLSDIAAIRHSYRYEYKKLRQTERPTLDHSIEVDVYVRADSAVLSAVPFLSIDVDHRSTMGHYVIGRVELDELHRCAAFADPTAFIAVFNQD